jgi:hypothetical protein
MRENMTEKAEKSTRKYPAFYEKLVPVVLSVLAVIIVVVLIFTIAVGVGALKF